MWGLCFRYCLSFVLQQAFAEMAREGLTLNFVVEDGHQNSGAAAEIVRQIKKKNISGISEFLGAAITGDKKRVMGLQAPDGLATGAWHVESSPETVEANLVDVPQRVPLVISRPYQQLRAPIFRCHVDSEELAKFKEGYFADIKFRKEFDRRDRHY
jgi:hypothetical protein